MSSHFVGLTNNNRCLLTAVVLMSVFVSECESTTVLIDDIPVLLYVILHSCCVECPYMDNCVLIVVIQ